MEKNGEINRRKVKQTDVLVKFQFILLKIFYVNAFIFY